MTANDRLKYASKKAKRASKELFRKKPKEVKEELRKEKSLGNPENLIRPDSKDE